MVLKRSLKIGKGTAGSSTAVGKTEDLKEKRPEPDDLSDEGEVPAEENAGPEKKDARRIPDAPGSTSVSKKELEATLCGIKKSFTTPHWVNIPKDVDPLCEDAKETGSAGEVSPTLQIESKKNFFLKATEAPHNNDVRKLSGFLAKSEGLKPQNDSDV